MEATLDLLPDPGSVRAARRFVRDRLGEWDLTEIEDEVILIVSELVTNAVLHARTPLTLLVRRRDAFLRVAVSDESQAQPVRRHYSRESGTGRGIALVERIAADWGVEAIPSERTVTVGKTVWVDFSLDAQTWAGLPSWDEWFAEVEPL